MHKVNFTCNRLTFGKLIVYSEPSNVVLENTSFQLQNGLSSDNNLPSVVLDFWLYDYIGHY